MSNGTWRAEPDSNRLSPAVLAGVLPKALPARIAASSAAEYALCTQGKNRPADLVLPLGLLRRIKDGSVDMYRAVAHTDRLRAVTFLNAGDPDTRLFRSIYFCTVFHVGFLSVQFIGLL